MLRKKINFLKSGGAGLFLLLIFALSQALAQNHENHDFSLPAEPFWSYINEEDGQWFNIEDLNSDQEVHYGVDLQFKLPPSQYEENTIFRIAEEEELARDPLYNPFHWSFQGRTIKLGRHKDPVCKKFPDEIRALLSYCQYKYFMSFKFKVQ